MGTTQILARARSHHHPETEETRGGGSDSGSQEPGLPGRIGTMDGQRKLKPLLELPPCPERLLKYERVWENDLSLSHHLPVWRFLLAEPN